MSGGLQENMVVGYCLGLRVDLLDLFLGTSQERRLFYLILIIDFIDEWQYFLFDILWSRIVGREFLFNRRQGLKSLAFDNIYFCLMCFVYVMIPRLCLAYVWLQFKFLFLTWLYRFDIGWEISRGPGQDHFETTNFCPLTRRFCESGVRMSFIWIVLRVNFW